MNIHRLAIFWRDMAARCFTIWHFKPGKNESGISRAEKILQLVSRISRLQIYGVLLDNEPLKLPLFHLAPEQGSEQRLEVELIAGDESNSSHLQFSIPSVITALEYTIKDQQPNFNEYYWQQLNQEVFSYLCLPNGVVVSLVDRLARVQRAAIVELSAEDRPKPDRPPIDLAIIEILEQLTSLPDTNQNPDQLVLLQQARIEARLAYHQFLQSREADFYAQATDQTLIIDAPREAEIEVSPFTSVQAITVEMIETITAAAIGQRSVQTVAPAQQTKNFYPVIPESETEQAEWIDIDRSQFLNSANWYHRSLIKQRYQITERSYFRWINQLREHGLSRFRPATVDWKIKLFYLPDIEKALAARDGNSKLRPRRARVTTTTNLPAALTFAPTQFDQTLARLIKLTEANQELLKTISERLLAPSDNKAILTQVLEIVAALARSQEETIKITATKIEAELSPLRGLISDLRNFFSAQTAQTTQTGLPRPRKKAVKKAKKTKTAKAAKIVKVSRSLQVGIDEAAKILNISPVTVRRRCESGKIKARKSDGRWLIDRRRLKK